MNMQQPPKIEMFCSVYDFDADMSKQFKKHDIQVTSVFGFIFVPIEQVKLATNIYYGRVEA